jgi:hypothetical protein
VIRDAILDALIQAGRVSIIPVGFEGKGEGKGEGEGENEGEGEGE